MVHTEVPESLLSDVESMSSTLTSTKVVDSNLPRFLVISSSDNGVLKTLSPFAIQKGLVGLAREPNC